MHLFGPLARRAANNPEAVFCHFVKRGEHRRVTAGEVMHGAAAVAAALRDSGVAAGDIVPIVLEHRLELYSSFIGCTLAGAVPAFLPPLTQKQDLDVFRRSMAALLARIGAGRIIGSASTLPTLDLADGVGIDVDRPMPDARTMPLPDAEPDGLAALQHSSGTTGLKKGVCLSHGTVLDHVDAYARAIGLTPNDRIASWLPLYHDMGLVTAFLMPAITGIPVVSLDALEWTLQPTMLLDAIERYAATLCWLPNFAFHHMARMASPDRSWNLASLRMLVNCSEPCRAGAFAKFLDRFAGCGVTGQMLQASYAMAENVFGVTQTVGAARHSGLPELADYVSSGRPVASVELVLRDAAGAPVAERTVGEILLRSRFLTAGYFRQPELMPSRMRDGFFVTGDLGFLDHGELFVIGRNDDVLNINGRKILAHEVEQALAGVGGLIPGRILVFAEHDSTTGATQLRVAAERDANETAEDQAVAAKIRRAVFAQCAVRPHAVTLHERGFLLKSTSGKLARAATVDKLQAAAASPSPA